MKMICTFIGVYYLYQNVRKFEIYLPQYDIGNTQKVSDNIKTPNRDNYVLVEVIINK